MTDALAIPRARITDVRSALFDFVITTWDVEPEALERHLPAGLFAERFPSKGGGTHALVSAVTFLNTSFYVGFAPFVRLTCEQTNYRAYVRRPGGAGGGPDDRGERAVWFFGTGLAHPFVLLPRHAWRLPWHRMHVERTSTWEGERLVSLRWHARAEGAEEVLALRGTGRSLEVLDGFASREETHAVLTHPLVGYVRRRDDRVVTYGVWHRPLEVEIAEAAEARFQRFEALGLVAPGQPPSSVLVQRATDFLVLLPPRRVPALDPRR